MPPDCTLRPLSYLAAIGVCVAAPSLWATWQDNIGYNTLAGELGAGLPIGAGVSVTVVEGAATSEGEYLPVSEPLPSSGGFAGKQFVFQSGDSGVSSHSFRVGTFIFGLNTNAALGDASLAPAAGLVPVDRIDVYEVDDWLDSGFLDPGHMVPRVESNAVANHSWITYTDASSPAPVLNDLLRRLDFSVNRDDYVCVVGINNGAATAQPQLLASAYNVIAVGLTNGSHSTGATPADVDGPGRTKPELVVPLDRTSWATAVVSSAAVFLTSHAQSTPGLGNGTRPELLRAVLSAGATKDEFPGWANSRTQPLDLHFGAGQLNIRRSYHLLSAGERNAAPAAVLPGAGWDYSSPLAPGTEKNYTFVVPDECLAAEFSAALVWNRQITGAAGSMLENPEPRLPNLDLFLHRSTDFVTGPLISSSESGSGGSPAHTIEHLFVRNLPAGEYSMRVRHAGTESFSTDYALAWTSIMEPARPPQLASVLAPDASTLALECSDLCAGLTYNLQRSTDLVQWTTVRMITAPVTPAPAAAVSVIVIPTQPREFYRILWSPP